MIPFIQPDEDMTTCHTVVQFFEGWGCRAENDVAWLVRTALNKAEHQGCVTPIVSRGGGVLLV